MPRLYKFLILGGVITLVLFANYQKKDDSKIIFLDADVARRQALDEIRGNSWAALPSLVDAPPIIPAFFEEELSEQNNISFKATASDVNKYLLINKSIQEISAYIFQELLLKERNRNLIRKEAKASVLISEKEGFLGDAKNNKIELERFDFEEPDISAEAALVADFHTDQVYWVAGGEKRLPIASLTKLMTAAVVMKNMNLDDFIEIEEGTNFKNKLFYPGSRYLIRDIVKIMLLASDNDAAEILTKNYGKEKFIAEMNKLAEDWGLGDTFFDDSTGISATNQSTVYDIKKMVAQINYLYPEILKITRQSKEVVVELKTKKRNNILSINQFSGQPNFLGGKTGYTDEAGGNLVSIFSYQNRPIIFIVLGTKSYEARFEETKKLFDWFKNNF